MMNRSTARGFGICAFAAAAIFLGVVGLVSRDFATGWQRVPYGFADRTALALAAAALELGAGIAILVPRLARIGVEHTPTIWIVTNGGHAPPFVEVVDRNNLFQMIDQALAETRGH